MAHASQEREIQYLKIFDAIEKQEIYNEPLLLKKFSEEGFVRQFSVAKNYLTFLILKSLVQFHAAKSAESQLSRLLDFASVLYDKGFYRECLNELSKAKKLAYAFDKHDFTLTIIKREKQLVAGMKNEKMNQDLHALLEEEHQVLEYIKMESELGFVYFNLLREIHYDRIRRSEVDLEGLHRLRERIKVIPESSFTTFNSRNFFYGLETIYNYMVNNFKRAEYFGRLHCQLWQENPVRFNDENNEFLEVYYHYISSCFQTGNFIEIKHCLERIRDFNANTSDKKQRKFFIYYSLKLRYCATLAKYKEAEEILQEIEEKIGDIEPILSTDYHVTINLNCAIVYFVLDRYSDSLRWLNNYFNTFSKDIRKDIYSFARILNLMLHYKLGNTELIDPIIKNTYRELRRQSRIFNYEKVVLDFIKWNSKPVNRKNGKEHVLELQKKLDALRNDPLERDAMRYFNFSRWIESEIKKVPYRELAEKELK